MPVYEYFCGQCHTKFEALRPMREADAPIKCVECNSSKPARVLSVFFATSGGKPIEGTGGGCACGHGTCGCGHGHH